MVLNGPTKTGKCPTIFNPMTPTDTYAHFPIKTLPILDYLRLSKTKWSVN